MLSGIECHGGTCEAAGVYAPRSAAEGVLVSLTDCTSGTCVGTVVTVG